MVNVKREALPKVMDLRFYIKIAVNIDLYRSFPYTTVACCVYSSCSGLFFTNPLVVSYCSPCCIDPIEVNGAYTRRRTIGSVCLCDMSCVTPQLT